MAVELLETVFIHESIVSVGVPVLKGKSAGEITCGDLSMSLGNWRSGCTPQIFAV